MGNGMLDKQVRIKDALWYAAGLVGSFTLGSLIF